MRHIEIKLTIAALGLMGLTGVASAADLPVKAAPPMPPPCVWCGWYIGGNVGGMWGNNDEVFSGNAQTDAFFAANEFPARLMTSPTGAIGGGQVGYNWEVAPRLIAGIEADIQGSNFRGSAISAPVPTGGFVPFTTSVEQRSDWFGTVRGRIGLLAGPNVLTYFTGGLAYGQAETSFNTVATGFTLATCPANFSCTTASSSSTRVGWTVGGGLEWMFAPKWSVKAEYLYMDLGNASATGVPTPGGVTPPGFANTTFTAGTAFRENILRVGFNYHL